MLLSPGRLPRHRKTSPIEYRGGNLRVEGGQRRFGTSNRIGRGDGRSHDGRRRIGSLHDAAAKFTEYRRIRQAHLHHLFQGQREVLARFRIVQQPRRRGGERLDGLFRGGQTNLRSGLLDRVGGRLPSLVGIELQRVLAPRTATADSDDACRQGGEASQNSSNRTSSCIVFQCFGPRRATCLFRPNVHNASDDEPSARLVACLSDGDAAGQPSKSINAKIFPKLAVFIPVAGGFWSKRETGGTALELQGLIHAV